MADIRGVRKMRRFYTIWKVLDLEGKVLMEGKYGECYRYLNENAIVDAKLEPFMYEHKNP